MKYICRECGASCVLDDGDGEVDPYMCPCNEHAIWEKFDSDEELIGFTKYICSDCRNSVPCVFSSWCEDRIPVICPYFIDKCLSVNWKEVDG